MKEWQFALLDLPVDSQGAKHSADKRMGGFDPRNRGLWVGPARLARRSGDDCTEPMVFIGGHPVLARAGAVDRA